MQPRPFLKWVGGKTQLLPQLKRYTPEKFGRYYEPFVGAGALLFDLQPTRAVINDLNWELINCYRTIKENHSMILIELGRGYFNDEKNYYRIREWDRSDKWPKFFQSWEIAARTIYLNKNGYNGLYRVNAEGQFNTPYGKHKGEYVPDSENIIAVNRYLNENDVTIINVDFEKAVEDARPGDFVYFDSPYWPVSETAKFTAYTAGGFGTADQKRLMETACKLRDRGVYVMLSNADVLGVWSLYGKNNWNFHQVQARRNINSKGTGRGLVGELIITSY